jgi:hypothetical protein
MTVRTTGLGGTAFVDGETLYAADVNDTINASTTILNNTSTGHSHNGTDSKFIARMVLNQFTTATTISNTCNSASGTENTQELADITSTTIAQWLNGLV